MLTPFARDLWEHNAPLVVLGMHLGHRMTVARLPDGSLWVHSPVRYTAAAAAALAELGPVAHVIAPTTVHDTYLEGWFSAYPRARHHGAPGFARSRPDLKFTDTLRDAPNPAWAEILDQHVLRGMPLLNEVVFLHRSSGTLIVADLSFNLGPDMPLLSRVLLKLNGCYDRFGPSRMLRSTIRDRAAFRSSLQHILAWDFDAVIVGHGDNIRSGGKEMLRDAFAFL